MELQQASEEFHNLLAKLISETTRHGMDPIQHSVVETRMEPAYRYGRAGQAREILENLIVKFEQQAQALGMHDQAINLGERLIAEAFELGRQETLANVRASCPVPASV